MFRSDLVQHFPGLQAAVAATKNRRQQHRKRLLQAIHARGSLGSPVVADASGSQQSLPNAPLRRRPKSRSWFSPQHSTLHSQVRRESANCKKLLQTASCPYAGPRCQKMTIVRHGIQIALAECQYGVGRAGLLCLGTQCDRLSQPAHHV